MINIKSSESNCEKKEEETVTCNLLTGTELCRLPGLGVAVRCSGMSTLCTYHKLPEVVQFYSIHKCNP